MTAASRHQYDNPYYADNVYGHAVDVLRQHATPEARGKVHLDLGCGFGRIAEPLQRDLGVTYIGVDGSDVGLQSLAERGFETHQLVLEDEAETLRALTAILDSRSLASITLLDTLEHLHKGDEVLRCIRGLAYEQGATVVISVPNVSHRDIAFKLAVGHWEYTDVGLLDRTHVRLFSRQSFEATLREAGLHPISSNDVLRATSDQRFPVDHPILADHTLVNRLLRQLEVGAGASPEVNQFVRLCIPGPMTVHRPPEGSLERNPFLSILTRTQGKRLHTLQEVLTALAGQTSTNFELLVLGHRLPPDRQRAVERMLDDSPSWLREKTRIVLVDGGNRTRPLNVGLEIAKGQYVAILDDDDLPFAHWVEEFEKLAERGAGTVLRTVAVRQDVRVCTIGGRSGVRATGGLEKIFPSDFDLLQHLRVNSTPPVSVAFPRGAFRWLGFRFDESLTTTEDWDYLMRVVAVVGVTCSPKITSVYRWWKTDDSSRTEHDKLEWLTNHHVIFNKLDRSLVLFPVGTTAQIRFLLDERDRLWERCAETSDIDARVKDHLARRFATLVNAGKYDQARAIAEMEELDQLPYLRDDYGKLLSAKEQDMIFHFAVLDLQAGGDIQRAGRRFARVRVALEPSDALFWPSMLGEMQASERNGDDAAIERLIAAARAAVGNVESRIPEDVRAAKKATIKRRLVHLVNSGQTDEARTLIAEEQLEEPSGHVLDKGDRDTLFVMGVLDVQGEGQPERARKRFARVREGLSQDDGLFWAALQGEMVSLDRQDRSADALELIRTVTKNVREEQIPEPLRERLGQAAKKVEARRR